MMLVETTEVVPVSVVIPCYRCTQTIERALNSISMQTMRPAEVILVDDGSGDSTLEKLNELNIKYGDWIRVIPLPENLGVATARNKGWSLAKNPYIAFLDADDAWHPKKIEVQYQYMVSNPSIDMSGHAHKRLSKSTDSPSWEIGDWSPKVITKTDILLSNRFVTPSVMLKKDISFRFTEGKRHMEDHLLWAQIISSGLKVVKLSTSLAAIYKFPYGVSGLSSQTTQMQAGEINNYRQLSQEGYLNFLSLNALIALATAKAIKRFLVVAFLIMLTPTAKHIANYMSLTYSITGLMVILGIAGKHAMSSDVAIVQGAVLATFYVLSGDARHLILAEKMGAENVTFFRLLLVLPLAVLSYFMSVEVANVEIYIALAVILRRSLEWLVEPHVTEIERTDQRWPGLKWQILCFVILVVQILFFDQSWFIWLWALSPIIFSVNFLMQAKFHNFLLIGKANLASTAMMGLSNYVFRVFIVSLVGKVYSGMLFPAIAIGSLAGTLFANVAGPTLVRKALVESTFFKNGLLALSMLGLIAYASSKTFFIQTLGLSMVGGAIMVAAQRARLISLKENHTLSPDLLVHLILVCITPIIYYSGGLKWLMGIYLVNAILAWVFYKGNSTYMKLNSISRDRLITFFVLLLLVPVFFQLKGSIYNDSGPLGLVDSGGKISIVPLPFSLIGCYLGLVIFNELFQYAKVAIVTIGSMFFLQILSCLVSGYEPAKLTLLVQFILPTVALLLGIAIANIDRLLIARTFLYFLLFFVPIQLICTWIQGNLALTHYLYVFSVYQNYQYLPLIIASLFAWVWLELEASHKNTIYILAPWVGIYMAAGNSILALFGLVAFSLSYAFKSKSRQNIFILLLIGISISSYFLLNSKVATLLPKYNISHGVFVGKLFSKNGSQLYTDSSNTKIPINVSSRLDIAKRYIGGINESSETFLFGHSSPPPRTEITSGHNYYLDLTYNYGILACLPILTLAVFTIARYVKNKSNYSNALWMLLIVLYLVLIDSNFKVTLRQPYPAIITFFLWGILLSTINPKKQHSLT